jgi:hypothetical protein
VESEVIDKRESRSRPNVGIVSWVHRAYNQKGELVYEVRRCNLVYKRDYAPWKRFIKGEEVTGRLCVKLSIPSYTNIGLVGSLMALGLVRSLLIGLVGQFIGMTMS